MSETTKDGKGNADSSHPSNMPTPTDTNSKDVVAYLLGLGYSSRHHSDPPNMRAGKTITALDTFQHTVTKDNRPHPSGRHTKGKHSDENADSPPCPGTNNKHQIKG